MTTTSATSTTSASTATAAAAATSTTPTNASIGQSILTSLNASGSGIDTDSLTTSLTAAQKVGLETPITTKQTANTAQISSAATISSDLTNFANILNTLVSGGTLQAQPASSNPAVLTVSALSGQTVGDLSSSITVNALATAQSLKSAGFSSPTFDTGTLTITIGSGSSATSVPVTIDSSNNTLTGIAAAINAQKAGITANVVTASDGTQTLTLRGPTGAANAFTVSASDANAVQASGTSALSALAYGQSGTTNGMTSTGSAADASLTVDGVTVTRPSNTITDLLPGAQLTLVAASTTPVTLSATVPTDAITSAVNEFVGDYNQLIGDIATATAGATDTSDAGPLRGNSAIRSIRSQLSQLTTTNLNASGSIRTLAEIGVKTGQDGTLSVDATKLAAALATHPDDVSAMFMSSQSSSSSRLLINSKVGAVPSGVYALTNLTSAVNGGNAAGTINGAAMTASSWVLTAPVGGAANGLVLQVLSSVPSTATVTVNQGLSGLLQSIVDGLNQTATNRTTGAADPIGALASLTASLAAQKTSLAAALTAADAQVTVYHDRLVTQFTTMNTQVSAYKATQSYLTQQVDLWTKGSSS